MVKSPFSTGKFPSVSPGGAAILGPAAFPGPLPWATRAAHIPRLAAVRLERLDLQTVDGFFVHHPKDRGYYGCIIYKCIYELKWMIWGYPLF